MFASYLKKKKIPPANKNYFYIIKYQINIKNKAGKQENGITILPGECTIIIKKYKLKGKDNINLMKSTVVTF